jgi:hypothetical protein
MSNSIDIKNRVHIIACELEQGTSSEEIRKKYLPYWGVSERTMRRYFAFACDELRKQFKDLDALIEAQRGAFIEDNIEIFRSKTELLAMLFKIMDSGIESEKISVGPIGTTVVKSRISLGELRRTIDFFMKTMNPGLREDNKRPEGPVLIVKTAEQKALIEQTALMD